jgi:hypothetical protein
MVCSGQPVPRDRFNPPSNDGPQLPRLSANIECMPPTTAPTGSKCHSGMPVRYPILHCIILLYT